MENVLCIHVNFKCSVHSLSLNKIKAILNLNLQKKYEKNETLVRLTFCYLINYYKKKLLNHPTKLHTTCSNIVLSPTVLTKYFNCFVLQIKTSI